MKKRLLAAIMSLCMIVSLLPVSALAAPKASVAVGETVEITGTKIHNGWFGNYNCYDHKWSSNDPSVATVTDGGAGLGHIGIVTGVARGEVTVTHSYKYDAGLITESDQETFTVQVTRPAGRSQDMYFFLALPTNTTLSNEPSQYRYLTYGGTPSSSAASIIEGNAGAITDLTNEENIKQYISTWPTTLRSVPSNGHSSTIIGEGSTWSINSSTGNVESFNLYIDGTRYSSDQYGIRWAKISYYEDRDSEYDSDFGYHVDGVLYKKVLAQAVLDKGLSKAISDNSLSLDESGTARIEETFKFVLDAKDDTENAFDDIYLTAKFTTNSGSVQLSFNDPDDSTRELPVGNYVVWEDLSEYQEKAWKAPEAIEFDVNSDGSITFVDNNQTITNTLETYTLSYDAGAGTGAPTGDTYKYNEKTSVSSIEPTRDGYEFLGWDSDGDDAVNYHLSDSIQIKGNVELVAVWEKVFTENLSIEKTVKLLDGETPVDLPAGGVKVNDTLQYNVTVTNNGTAVKDVVVTDIMFPNNGTGVIVTYNNGTTPSVDWSMGSATITSELAKGESVTFTYTYPVTEQDQYYGTVSNTASVTFNGVQQDTDTRTVSVKAKTYSLTYNANGGTFGNNQPTFVVDGLESGTKYPLGKEANYQKPIHAQANFNGKMVDVAFIGWTLSNNNKYIYSVDQNVPNSETSITIQTNDAANTVYAIWGYDTDSDHVADVLENTVTFDADGGTPEPETQYVQDGEKATKPADPAKAGFTFAEWYLEGATTPYDFSTPVTEDITLVAHWTDATQYTVTFDPNGGSLTSAPTVTVPPNTPVTKPADPTWNDDYIFMGWTTTDISGETYGVGETLPGMVFQNSNTYTPTGTTTLYAVWGEDSNHDDVADVYEVFIAPADITIYTGGTGYSGVTDEDGNVIDEYEGSGLPEPGFHIILPADLGIREGSNLENVLTFHYSGEDSLTGTTVDHTWTLSYVGVYSMNPTRYVYSLSANSNGVPIRILYKDGAGNVQDDDQIDMSANAASAEYTMSINHGGLTPTAIQAVITKTDGSTDNRNLVIGTGELTIRSTVDDDTTAIVNHENSVTTGDFTAVGNNASYMVNNSQVPVTTANNRVQLLVDEVSDSADFNNAMGEAAVEKATVSGTAHETVYLDLVDTQNGNTVVTLDSGSMDIYWPMPSDADPYGDFQVVHYVDMNRENTTTEGELAGQRTEVLTGTPVYTNGDWYVRFTTHSFSPFVLVYEEDTSRPVNPNPGGGSGGDSDSDPTGNLSIELDVNGGDDEFTFTVILTDKDGDDLENNFYYNGDYTGTIGSGDEITLEGGDKIVIRNLPEGTRYEVIIETADGYTYVIDGEEGVIHTGMNEAEFTATRTVPVADPSVTGVSRWLNTTDHIAYLTGYPGGAFGPDNNMTRAEVAQMFYALLNNKNVTITKTFPDVPADAWYATAVNTLASLGMVSGDENGNYRPNDPITRAEFCVIALAFAYEPENAVCYFGDVSRSDWFYTYVAQAASYGWIGGYTNGNFGPNDRITRAQVTTIVNNMLGRAADRDYVIDHQADLVQFTDLTRAHWGYFQIMEATNAHDYTKSNGTENWR